MIKLAKSTISQLIKVYENNGIFLEGNILKLIDYSNDKELEDYINLCIENDKENRKKRLEITKQIQSQNKELTNLNEEKTQILEELKIALSEMEDSKIKIEKQNEELIEWKNDNERISIELSEAMKKSEEARIIAEHAKERAVNDLDLLQKKTQTELMGKIVRVALFVIIGIGITTTLMYSLSLITGSDTQMIGSTWSNMFGILLTNSFSIIGTIMGVKYANQRKEDC